MTRLVLASIVVMHSFTLSCALFTAPAVTIHRPPSIAARAQLFARANTDQRRKAKSAKLKVNGNRRASAAVNEFGVLVNKGPAKASKRHIEVVLLTPVNDLGAQGEFVRVSRAMFENALLPSGKARLPTKADMNRLQQAATNPKHGDEAKAASEEAASLPSTLQDVTSHQTGPLL